MRTQTERASESDRGSESDSKGAGERERETAHGYVGSRVVLTRVLRGAMI